MLQILRYTPNVSLVKFPLINSIFRFCIILKTTRSWLLLSLPLARAILKEIDSFKLFCDSSNIRSSILFMCDDYSISHLQPTCSKCHQTTCIPLERCVFSAAAIKPKGENKCPMGRFYTLWFYQIVLKR